jgi:hypothetical protein
MTGLQRAPVRLLPRLAAAGGRAASAANAAGLLGAALVGAALVHLLAYHIPLGLPTAPHWSASFMSLLANCPLLGPLGAIAAIAVLAPLLLLREVVRLECLNRALERRLTTQRVAALRGETLAPRSPRRLAGFILALLLLQVALFSAAGLVCPMHVTMLMGGKLMAMSTATALPLAPLHLVVATLIGLLLWRVERRLTRLRDAVAQRLSLLTHEHVAYHPQIPASRDARLPLGWYGQPLFARPPPAAA